MTDLDRIPGFGDKEEEGATQVAPAGALTGAPPTPAAKEPAEKKEAEKQSEKKPTDYLVMVSTDENGPWNQIRNFEAHGQIAAKRAAAEYLNEQGGDASQYYYIAIPVSSFAPEKPSVETTTKISF